MQNSDVSSNNCLTLEQLIHLNPRDFLTAVDKNPSLMFLGLTPRSLQALSRNASIIQGTPSCLPVNHPTVPESRGNHDSSTITSPESQSSSSHTSVSSTGYYSSPATISGRAGAQTMIACEICPKSISKKNFKAHMEIHDGCRNQHHCGSCGNPYYFLRDLMKHRKEKHRSVTRNNDKHICGICHDSFTDYQTMKKHRKNLGCFLF